MLTSRETQRLAYAEVQRRLGQNHKRRAIYMYLQANGPACNRQISDRLGKDFPINIVTARVKELRELGLLVQHGQTHYPSGSTTSVVTWRALAEAQTTAQDNQLCLL